MQGCGCENVVTHADHHTRAPGIVLLQRNPSSGGASESFVAHSQTTAWASWCERQTHG